MTTSSRNTECPRSASTSGAANEAVGSVLGTGPAGQVLAVAGAVAFTALAGLLLCELRRRSGSLLAAAALHWATNGLGLLITAGLAAVRLA